MAFGERTNLVKARASRRNIVVCALSALVYVVAFGMVASYSAPACVDMLRPGSRFAGLLSAQQVAWIASLPSLAGVVGNAVSGYVSHLLGRKAVLMYISASYTLSWLAIAYAPNIGTVYLGRLVSGFCAGVCAVAVPAYVVEISAVEIRGALASGFQTAFALGVFAVMALGAAMRWSWLAVCAAALVATGACLLLVLAPESPPWLVRASRNVEAFQGLRFLRRDYHDAAREFQEISDNLKEESCAPFRLAELMDPQLYRPAIIAISLMLFQQFSGINAIMSYAVELLGSSENFVDPSLAATGVALVQVLATAVAALLMDRVGRRALFVASGLGIALSLCVGGAYDFYFPAAIASPSANVSATADVTPWTWVPVACLVAYIAAFSIGFGPVPFVVAPELVPTRSRSLLLASANVSGSLFGFLATRTFDDLRSAIGLSGLYWTYASFAILGACFYWTLVPETSGRAIRDIHRSFYVIGDSERPEGASD